MVKLVDAADSKSATARCVGSSPTLGTRLVASSHFDFWALADMDMHTKNVKVFR